MNASGFKLWSNEGKHITTIMTVYHRNCHIQYTEYLILDMLSDSSLCISLVSKGCRERK